MSRRAEERWRAMRAMRGAWGAPPAPPGLMDFDVEVTSAPIHQMATIHDLAAFTPSAPMAVSVRILLPDGWRVGYREVGGDTEVGDLLRDVIASAPDMEGGE